MLWRRRRGGLIFNPDHPYIHSNLAHVLLILKEYKAAGFHAFQSISLNPTFHKGYLRFAKAIFNDGDILGALDILNKGIALCDKKEPLKKLFDEYRKIFIGKNLMEESGAKDNSTSNHKCPGDRKAKDSETKGMSKGSEDSKKTKKDSGSGESSIEVDAKNSATKRMPKGSEDSKKTKMDESEKWTGESSIEVEVKTKNDDKTTVAKPVDRKVNENGELLSLAEQLSSKKHSIQKEQLTELLKEGFSAASKLLYSRAIDCYKEALKITVIPHMPNNSAAITPLQEFGITETQVIIIKYILNLMRVESGSYDKIVQAITDLKTLEHFQYTFPTFLYITGKAYYKLNRFKIAIEPLEKCEDLLIRGIMFSSHCWPGTNVIIMETEKDTLQVMVSDLLQLCKSCLQKQPTAICRFNRCLETNSHHIAPSEHIFVGDPDFGGYITIKCEEKCTIQYHVKTCWKVFKETLSKHKKVTDKDMLGHPCPTTDCVNSSGKQSTITSIEIIGQDGNVKSFIKGELTGSIGQQISKNKRKKTSKSLSEEREKPPETSKKVKPEKVKKIKTGKTIPAENKKDAGQEGCKISVAEKELAKRLDMLGNIRAVNFGCTNENSWNPREPHYGRPDEQQKEEKFVNNENVDDCQSEEFVYKDFIKSYFYELLSTDGPQKMDDIQESWENDEGVFCDVKSVVNNVTSICDLLLESTLFCLIDDNICVSERLPETYEEAKTELTESIAFMINGSMPQPTGSTQRSGENVNWERNDASDSDGEYDNNDDDEDDYYIDTEYEVEEEEEEEEESDTEEVDDSSEDEESSCEDCESGKDVELPAEPKEDGSFQVVVSSEDNENADVQNSTSTVPNISTTVENPKSLFQNTVREECEESLHKIVEDSKTAFCEEQIGINSDTEDKQDEPVCNEITIQPKEIKPKDVKDSSTQTESYLSLEDKLGGQKKKIATLNDTVNEKTKVIKDLEAENNKLETRIQKLESEKLKLLQQSEKTSKKLTAQITKKESAFLKEKEQLMEEKKNLETQFGIMKQMEQLFELVKTEKAEQQKSIMDLETLVLELKKERTGLQQEQLKTQLEYCNHVFKMYTKHYNEKITDLSFFLKLDRFDSQDDLVNLFKKWDKFKTKIDETKLRTKILYDKFNEKIAQGMGSNLNDLLTCHMVYLKEPQPLPVGNVVIKLLESLNQHIPIAFQPEDIGQDYSFHSEDDVDEISSIQNDYNQLVEEDESDASERNVYKCEQIHVPSSTKANVEQLSKKDFLKPKKTEKDENSNKSSSKMKKKDSKNVSKEEGVAAKTEKVSKKSKKKVNKSSVATTAPVAKAHVPSISRSAVIPNIKTSSLHQQPYKVPSLMELDLGYCDLEINDPQEENEEWQPVHWRSKYDNAASVPVLVGCGKVKSHYAKLMERLQKRFPEKTEKDLTECVKLVRERNSNSLSGLAMDEIEFRVEKIFADKSKKPTSMGLEKFGETVWGPRSVNEVQWQGSSGMEECIICYEELGYKALTTLECNHPFHTECIRHWLREKSVCPLCNMFTKMPDEFPAL